MAKIEGVSIIVDEEGKLRIKSLDGKQIDINFPFHLENKMVPDDPISQEASFVLNKGSFVTGK